MIPISIVLAKQIPFGKLLADNKTRVACRVTKKVAGPYPPPTSLAQAPLL